MDRSLTDFGLFRELSPEERGVVELSARVKGIQAKGHLLRQGDAPQSVHFLLSGFTARSKSVSDGGRQITAVLIPGDSCDLKACLLGHRDHDVHALSDCMVAELPRNTVLNWINLRPRITRALWWSTMADDAITSEWLINIGQREAVERISHLLCEMLFRLKRAELVSDDGFDFPLTQQELGEATGLSTVHVNRSVQALRANGLITLRDRHLKIHDVDRLAAIAMCDPEYLRIAGK